MKNALDWCFAREEIMPKIFLICLLLLGAAFADLRVPAPWTPGWFDLLGENPAQKREEFLLGALWTEPMENVDFSGIGVIACWGNGRYAAKTSFVHSALDSIYHSEAFGLDLSTTIGFVTFGLGGMADVQVIPGEATWWTAVYRGGILAEWKRLGADLWTEIPSDLERKALLGEIKWGTSRFEARALVRYKEKSGWQFVLGENLQIGAIGVSGSLGYPGIRIGIGIRIVWGAWGFGFGAHRDGNYADSKVFSAFYQFNAK